MTRICAAALGGGIIGTVVLVSACGGGGDDTAPTVSKEQLCQDVANTAMPDATFTAVEHHPSGDFTAPDKSVVKGLPAFCRVAATLKPSADSNIRVEVWLPADNWNGKYLGLGNGGYAGSLDYSSLSRGLARRYAVAHTDMGTSPATALNGEVLQGHPEKWIDWGYRSTHLMTVLAKGVSQKYYSSAPARSYFIGCSTGGGQGFHEAERYPADYDGIIAGAPANDRLAAHTSVMSWWSASKGNPASELPPAKVTLIANAAIAACDAADGVADAIISRPEKCGFKPQTLQCAGPDAADCLTAPQAATAAKLYAGVTNTVTGEVYPGLAIGSEPSWSLYTGGAPAGTLPLFGGLYTWVFGPNFDWRTFDYGADLVTSQTVLAPMISAISGDLKAFRDRGGRMISYHGTADIIISHYRTNEYVQKIESTTGQSANFLRYYVVPGMGHCGGGNAPTVFGGSLQSSPSAGDATRDLLTALEGWVEQGAAPDRIVASQYADATLTGAPARTRPLCPFPQVAKYDGSGDVNKEASFACVAPD